MTIFKMGRKYVTRLEHKFRAFIEPALTYLQDKAIVIRPKTVL